MPACSSAPPDTRAIRVSVSGSMSFPNGMCDHPTITAFFAMTNVLEKNSLLLVPLCKRAGRLVRPDISFQPVGLFPEQLIQMSLALRIHAALDRCNAQRADNLASRAAYGHRSEEHTSELQSLMRLPYAVFS